MSARYRDIYDRARAGDGEAFAELVAPHRRELQAHCYRLLGSLQDSEEALQESLLAAWQGFDRFEGRSSLRTWLYQVTTNKSLDLLRSVTRKAPTMATPRGIEVPEPSRMSEIAWLQPYPDALLDHLIDQAPGPEAIIESREAISLAFIAAVQMLPPRQRAVLILRDVLGYRAREVAEMLDTSEESVTSALKRARATLAAESALASSTPDPGSIEEQRVVERFAVAFANDDVEGIVALLSDAVRIAMPPMPFEYRGRAAADRFFTAVTPPDRPPRRLRQTRANGQPALASYRQDPATLSWRCDGVVVLRISDGGIDEITRFDPAMLEPFGLPRILPPLNAEAL